MQKLPVKLATGATLRLSPSDHGRLIKAIIEEFAPHFVPGGALIYARDSGEKWGYFDQELLAKLGVGVDTHATMPDVVLHFPERGWLFLIESVSSHGPVDGKRHGELARQFAGSTARLVYVTAFPSRAAMTRYLGEIAWETHAWVSDEPLHLIHFNGGRILGPYV
jgi:hypothetical protein